jgi:hypothetical protein
MTPSPSSPVASRTSFYLLALVVLLPATGVAQQRPDARRPGRPAEADGPLVEVAPIRCWWRASVGAVTIGEPFEVRLTCAVLENDSVQVVPDETRLTVAGVQLPPFEIVGGEHPADTRAGQRRFFQYRYTVRLVNADEIGQDVSLPRLPITYKVQSRVAANATLAGRDFTYMMPGLSMRVVSLVPEDAADIRDGADVGLERVEALRFRARLADIASMALVAAGVLLAVLAAVAVRARARPADATERPRVADGQVLGAASAELTRVAGEAGGGWTPELVGAAHAALRLVGAVALGRGVSEQSLAPATAPSEGRLAVRARLPWRPGLAIASATTTADLVRGFDESTQSARVEDRIGIEALRDALAAFTAARYTTTEAPLDGGALTSALAAGRTEAGRLARARRWAWLRHLVPRGFRGEAVRP